MANAGSFIDQGFATVVAAADEAQLSLVAYHDRLYVNTLSTSYCVSRLRAISHVIVESAAAAATAATPVAELPGKHKGEVADSWLVTLSPPSGGC